MANFHTFTIYIHTYTHMYVCMYVCMNMARNGSVLSVQGGIQILLSLKNNNI